MLHEWVEVLHYDDMVYVILTFDSSLKTGRNIQTTQHIMFKTCACRYQIVNV